MGNVYTPYIYVSVYRDIFDVSEYTEHLLCGASIADGKQQNWKNMQFIISFVRAAIFCSAITTIEGWHEAKIDSAAYIFKRQKASLENLQPKSLKQYELRNY